MPLLLLVFFPGPKVPNSQHEALIKILGGSYTVTPVSVRLSESNQKPRILHVPDTHFSRESDASPWSDRMHRSVPALGH